MAGTSARAPVKVAAVQTVRPKTFIRQHPGEKGTFLEETVRKVGFQNWQALDMAIHLQQFSEAQRDMEAAAGTASRSSDSAAAAARRVEYESAQARAQDAVQFMNSWIDAGYQNWRANQGVKKARIKRDLQFELSLLQREDLDAAYLDRRSQDAAVEGVAWFSRNMQRLGISPAPPADGAVANLSEPAMSYLRRIEAEVAAAADSAEAGGLMGTLQAKARQNRAARSERDKRRRKMLVDQRLAHDDLETKRAADAETEAAQAAGRREEREAEALSKAAQKKTRAAAARDDNVERLLNTYQAGVDAALAELSISAARRRADVDATGELQTASSERMRLQRDRTSAKSHAVALETARRIVDLVCLVIDCRAETASLPQRGRMSEAEWRDLRQRFVARGPLAHEVGDAATAGAKSAELEAYEAASHSWAIDGDDDGAPPDFWAQAEPCEAAVDTMRALVADPPPEVRPAFAKPYPRRVVVCVAGPRQNDEAIRAAIDLWKGVEVVTFESAMKGSMAAAAAAAAAAEDQGETPSLPATEVALREKGAQLQALHDSEAVDWPDMLRAETISTFLKRRVEAAPWTSFAVLGFAETLLQAKLLEHCLSGYVDAEIEAFVALQVKDKKKEPKAKTDSGKGDKKGTKRASKGDPPPSEDAAPLEDKAFFTNVVVFAEPEPEPAPEPAQEAEDAAPPADAADVPAVVPAAKGAAAAVLAAAAPVAQVVEELVLESWWRQRNGGVVRCSVVDGLGAGEFSELVDVFFEMAFYGDPPAADAVAADADKAEDDAWKHAVHRRLARRLSVFGPAQRLWREFTVTKSLDFDVGPMRGQLKDWAAEERAHRESVLAFAAACRDRAAKVQGAAESNTGQFLAAVRLPDPRWADLAQRARHFYDRGGDAGDVVDGLELALGDTVDGRCSEHRRVADLLVESTLGDAQAALDAVDARAKALVAAEVARFATALTLLDEFETSVFVAGANDGGAADAAAVLRATAARVAADDDAPLCDVFRAAAATALAAAAPKSAAGRRAAAQQPAAQLSSLRQPRATALVAAHVVRRLRSTAARLARTRAVLAATAAALRTELETATTQRLQAEHVAVATFCESFRRLEPHDEMRVE
ncbi:hypothetical protein M885DRAFT_521414 [Pelagophyceae sp. CCMP2097]|nr:hypothetical protein M885DRAFT_521414 [Pelagophyceae sp. CCMP2097]